MGMGLLFRRMAHLTSAGPEPGSSLDQSSLDQHGISERKEPIAHSDGLTISIANFLQTRQPRSRCRHAFQSSIGCTALTVLDEGCNHNQQRGTRQMEVGQQSINTAEAVAGTNE